MQCPVSRPALLLVLLSAAVFSAEEPNPDPSPFEAEDESCNTPASEDELPIVRVIRQIQFPGGRPNRPNRPFRPGQSQPQPQQPAPQFPTAPNGQCANCVPVVTCSFQLNLVQSICQLPEGGAGVCCPVQVQAQVGQGDTRLFKEPRRQVEMRSLSSEEVNSACQKGLEFVKQVDALEDRLLSSNQIVQRNTPAYGHLRLFRVTPSAREQHHRAQQIIQASRTMMSEFNLTPEQGTHGLRQMSVRNSILANNCPVAPTCNPQAKYRTIDGTCNNLANPLFGKSETAFQRILPPVYGDGVSSPRNLSAAGAELPSERVIASTVLVDRDDPDQQFTLSVMQWAQFIDHDLTLTPFSRMENGDGIECCPNGQEATGSARHPECLPIRLPRDDAFYAPRNRFCMNFIRSMLGLNQDCNFGHAEQMNQLTHWLDASNVYGSTQAEADRLRQRQGGLLLVSQNNLLPVNQSNQEDCQARPRGGVCFFAGETRVNEQPGLTAIHTLFHREHNRVARGLAQVNGGWSDEALYQEARRIVTAEYQHIIYNEWLPIIVGPNFMTSFGLNPTQRGFSFDYNSAINPTMNNEFGTAAFRFGHSLVTGFFRLISANNQVTTIQLRDHFNSPHIFTTQPGVLDMFVRSFSQQAIQKFDSFVTNDLSNHLFQTANQNFGMDLMSLNLHRGRDHGIAPYNAMREICGLRRARTFADFNDQIPTDIVGRLSQLYAHVDDVDFFVGGMSEKPVSGGLLGWTFLCVVGDQFARVKKGDRYFYDMGGQPGSFNEVQLQEIRKASWARILCDNGDNIAGLQPLAFRLPTRSFNAPQPCRSNVIPRVNLEAWSGEQPQA